MKKPIIFEHLDLNNYLREIYNYRKITQKNFSYEIWAEQIGISSKSYLRSIVLGEQKVVAKLIPNFVQELSLNDDETSYFIMLAHYSAADDIKIRDIYGKQLVKAWQKHINEIKVSDIEMFLTDSIIPIVFTYLSFEDVNSSPHHIAKDLNCDVDRITKALKCLVWQKLIEGSLDQQGHIQYKTTSEYFQIPDVHGNAAVRSFHLEGIEMAKNAIALPPNTRSYFGRFMALTEEDFLNFQKYLNEYLDTLVSKYDSTLSENKKIYRMNIQILPVSNVMHKIVTQAG